MRKDIRKFSNTVQENEAAFVPRLQGFEDELDQLMIKQQRDYKVLDGRIETCENELGATF